MVAHSRSAPRRAIEKATASTGALGDPSLRRHEARRREPDGLSAAGMRAAHQTLDGGMVFADPLAVRILGGDAEAAIAVLQSAAGAARLAPFCRHALPLRRGRAKRAIEAGVGQVLVLGAGLDTFAYRLEPREGLKVFELDHPATQRDKRARLAEAGIDEPPHLGFVAHDFEHGDMTEALIAGGLDVCRRTFVLWLGVTPYLTEEAVFATLGGLARFPGGVEVVFDYASPPHAIGEARVRDFHQAMAERVAASGEPFRCALETQALHERARAMGYRRDRGSGPRRSGRPLSAGAPVKPRPGSGGHVVRMATR